MKKVLAVLVCAVMLCLGIGQAEEKTTRRSLAVDLAEYCLKTATEFLKVYEQYPDETGDSVIKATYHYYQAYREMLGIERAEYGIEWGEKIAGPLLTGTEDLEKGTILDDELRETWKKWIDGEAEKEVLMGKLKIMIDAMNSVKDGVIE